MKNTILLVLYSNTLFLFSLSPPLYSLIYKLALLFPKGHALPLASIVRNLHILYSGQT